jgi:hypothetical protein
MELLSASSRRGRIAVAVGAALGVAATVGAAAILPATLSDAPTQAEAASPSAATPATTAAAVVAATGPAGPQPVACMAQLADAVAARPAETAALDRYWAIHSRWWGEDMAASGGSTVVTASTYESRLWRASDGSGRQDVIAIPGENSRPDSSSTYTAGGLAGVLAEPIETRPAVLAAQLQTHSPPQMGPQWVLRAIADVYHTHATAQPVRVALLRVLAMQTTGLQCEGGWKDRAGRQGIAVAVNSNSDSTRDRLIFDPVTGALLAAEEVTLINPPALRGPTPRTQSYWLLLQARHVNDLPAGSAGTGKSGER